MRDDLNSFKTTKSVLSLTSLHFYIIWCIHLRHTVWVIPYEFVDKIFDHQPVLRRFCDIMIMSDCRLWRSKSIEYTLQFTENVSLMMDVKIEKQAFTLYFSFRRGWLTFINIQSSGMISLYWEPLKVYFIPYISINPYALIFVQSRPFRHFELIL